MRNEPTNKAGYKSFSNNTDFIEDSHDIYEQIYDDLDDPQLEDETINQYRDAALIFATQLRTLLGYLADRIGTVDIKAKILIYSVILAAKCDDLVDVKSQRKLAKELKINYGTISHHKVAIERQLKDNIERM